MEPYVLIEDGEKYGGQYVTIKSFKEKEVISYGNDPVVVYNEAKKMGINEPVLFYVPKKNILQIYQCH